MLIIVTNNGWGISTPATSQHGEKHIIDRGKAFGIPGEVVDGNDPIASWHAIRRGMALLPHANAGRTCSRRRCRGCTATRRRAAPRASRDEPDCIELFEHKLLEAGVLDRSRRSTQVHDEAKRRSRGGRASRRCNEPKPTAEDVETHTYAPSAVDAVYPGRLHGTCRR